VIAGRFRARLRPVRARAIRVSAAVSLAATTACAPDSYMAISLVPGQVSAEVQDLARRAQVGDKQAQLDLGIRFEEGIGVPQDKAQAKKLYAQAAADSGGTIWVYVPSPGNGAPGRVLPVDTGTRQAGLEAAKARLQALDLDRSEKDMRP
jgi:hypothetical protein